jgi:urease accessory protein
MQPKSHLKNHKAIYILSYGGGMLQEDLINLTVTLHENTCLSLLTQASTKVFKRTAKDKFAKQILTAILEPNSFLCLLPEPVTCFKNSAYGQEQRFYLDSSSSLVVLDWITSGRTMNGEVWEFDCFTSHNRIYLDNELLVRDGYMLQDNPNSTLLQRMRHFNCIANVFFYGKECDCVIKWCLDVNSSDKIHRTAKISDIIWSMSPIHKDSVMVGLVVRIASVDTIVMRSFLKNILKPLEVRIGDYFSRI